MTETDTAPDLSLNEAFAEWKKTVQAELNGVPFEKRLVTRTFEDIALQPLYTRADLKDVRDLATAPGEAPFLRGARVGGNGRKWQAAQEIDATDSAEFNRALLANLQQGQDAVVLNPDAATLLASGSPALADAGAGIPLTAVKDFAAALVGVDLRAVQLHLSAGADPRTLASLYLAFAGQNKIPFDELRGSVTGDPLGLAALAGKFPGDLGETFDGIADWTQWASVNVPNLDTIGVNAAVWGDSGATATQELAIALSCAAEYLRALVARGISLDVVAGRIRFKFAVGPQFFTEVAKFRAFRPLWTRVLLAFGGSASLGSTATIAAATGRWNKTLLDPHVNMLRCTTEALSAVLGGCDALHIAPFDDVTGKTTGFSRRIALNVHTLLAEEFGFASTADPAGGSWYAEKLTDQIARAAWKQFQEFERRGGFAACLRSGYVQEQVEKSRQAKGAAVATRRVALVGTNLFPNLKEKPLSPVSPAKTETASSKKIARTEAAPKPVEMNGEWTFPSAIDAAREGSGATLLFTFFGKSNREEVAIPSPKAIRASEGFEALRKTAEALTASSGARPKVFLAKMGPNAQHKARADFSSAFFAVGGFEITAPGKYEDAASAATAAVKSGAKIAVLCSTDETYPTLAPAFAQAIKAENPKTIVVLAGLPTDPAVVASFRQAGFDDFIHARANVQEMLASLLDKIAVAT